MSVTGSIMAGVGLAGSIGGAAIGANAAGNAASDQSQAAEQAAQLQYQASQKALDFQKQQYGQNQQNLQPWLQSGTGALSNLNYMMGISPQTSQQFQGAGSMSFPGATNPLGSIPMSGGSQGGPSLPGGPASGSAGLSPRAMTTMAGGPAAGVGAATQGALGGVSMGGPTPTGSPALPQGGIGYNAPVASPGGGAAGPVGSIYGQGGVASGAPSLTGGPTLPQGGGATGAAPSGGFGSLMQAYPGGPFVAPTAAQGMQSPGTQEALQLGNQSLQQSAAARGSLLTGGTAQALDAFGQQLGSQNYQNAYNNALGTYGTNYNSYEQNQANQFNRLAAIAGVGQTTAQQLGTLGQSASNNVSSNLLGTASAMGQQYNNAAAANASGIIGSANAYGGALSGAGSSINNLLLLQQLQNMGGGTGIANYTGSAGANELNYGS